MNAFWNNTTEWLIHSALGVSVLLGAVCAALACTRQPARRQRLGELGIGAALLMPVLCLAPRWLVISWPTAPAALMNIDSPGAHQPVAEVAPIEEWEGFFFEDAAPVEAMAEAVPESAVANPQMAPATLVWPTAADLLALFPGVVTILFACGAGVLFLRWLIAVVTLLRLLRHAQPAPVWIAGELADACIDTQGVRVLVSARLRAPISCGLLRPTIVLPASLCRFCDRPRLRWIFAHELTHLRRGDAWSSLLLALGQIVLFPVPWFWWLRRQVRLCQEYVADAAASQAVEGRAAADYAEFLLSLTRVPAVPPGATGVSGSRSDLYRRLAMLLQNPMRVEQRCSQRWLMAAGVLFMALAVVLAGLSITPAAAQEVQSPVIAQVKSEPAQPQQPSVPQVPKTPEQPQPNTPAEPARKKDRSSAIEQLERALRDFGTPQDGKEAEALHEQIQQALKQLREMNQRGPGAGWIPNIEIDVRPFANFQGQPGFPGQPGFEFRRFPFDRGRLGISVDRPSEILADHLDLPKGEGLVVTDVVPKSVAEKAGIKANDILVELNKKPVKSDPGEFARNIMDMKGETAFDVVLLRKGKKMTLKDVKLPEPQRPEPPRPPFGPDISFPFRVGPGTVTTTVLRDKENFNANHREGRLSIRVSGKIDDKGTAKVERIVVQDGPQSNTYDSVEAVPADHRERVNRLLEISRGTGSEEKKK